MTSLSLSLIGRVPVTVSIDSIFEWSCLNSDHENGNLKVFVAPETRQFRKHVKVANDVNTRVILFMYVTMRTSVGIWMNKY